MTDCKIVRVLTSGNSLANEAVLRAACLMAGDFVVDNLEYNDRQPLTDVLCRGGFRARLEGDTMYVQCPTAAAAAAFAAMLEHCSGYGFRDIMVVPAIYLRVVLGEQNHGVPGQEIAVYTGPYISVQEARKRTHDFTYSGDSLEPTVGGCAITNIVHGLPHAPAFVDDDNCALGFPSEQVLMGRINIVCNRLLRRL